MLSGCDYLTGRKGKILLFTLGPLKNKRRGGAEKVLVDMANALVKRNYLVSILFCDACEEEVGFSVESGVSVVNAYKKSLSTMFYRNPWKNICSVSFTKEGRKEKREKLELKHKTKLLWSALDGMEAFDLCICFQVEALYYFKGILKNDIPVVTMLHGCPEDEYVLNSLSKYRDVVAKSDVIQVLLPTFSSKIETLFPDTRIEVIPNVAPDFGTRKSSVESNVIVSVGRLSHTKRPELLVRAFALLKDEFPTWRCEWWGERVGSQTLSLVQKLIAEFGLEDKFILRGSTDSVDKELEKASVFAFPTQWEGFSLAMAEAMAMGLPIVGCKDCSSLRSMIKNDINGYLVEPKPEDFADKLAMLMRDKKLRQQIGEKNKEDMYKYNADAVWGKWDKLIEEMIA